jgi:hypothetical protein
MTLVEIQVVISDNLIDALFCQVVDFTGLHLQDRSLLFCCINFWMLRVDMNCPEQIIAFLCE